jgi:hypothetical protein
VLAGERGEEVGRPGGAIEHAQWMRRIGWRRKQIAFLRINRSPIWLIIAR